MPTWEAAYYPLQPGRIDNRLWGIAVDCRSIEPPTVKRNIGEMAVVKWSVGEVLEMEGI